MKILNEENNLNELKSSLKVIYVSYIGKNTDNDNIYHFLITTDSENAWSEGWENVPAGIMRDLTPEDDMYEYIAEIKTELKLNLAQNNTCFSMQDCRDKIIALAAEDLSEAEEYPEDGRIVIHFGDLIEDVEKMLAKRDIAMNYI
jgi:hypothetical protein